MHWKKKYIINIPIIDTQHKQLFMTYEKLSGDLRTGLKAETIEKTLIKLQHYVSRHFTMEEKYMSASKYPKLVQQQEAHEYFSRRFTEILEDFQKNGLSKQIVQMIQQELLDWLKNHVTTLDMAFGKYYNSQLKKSD